MRNGKHKNGFWKKGSLTVEASLIVPMAILVCVLVILYCFYEHNRVWYTAAAYEAALVGTKKTEMGVDTESEARIRAKERMEIQPFPGSLPDCKIEMGKKKISVQYKTEGKTGFFRDFPYEVNGIVKQVNPVSGIRTAWIARHLMSRFGE